MRTGSVDPDARQVCLARAVRRRRCPAEGVGEECEGRWEEEEEERTFLGLR